MQIESVRRPLFELRDQFLRLGETWVKEGRHYGAAALRTSAQTLTETAERLDGLAAKLETGPQGDALVAPVATAEAFPAVEG